jgi:hypothetical protein
MLNALLSDRARKLITVQFDERRRLFPLDIRLFIAEAARRGSYHSGGMVIRLHDVHARELEIRTIIAWKSIVRAHQGQGSPLTDGLRQDLKQELNQHVLQAFNELTGSLVRELQPLKGMPKTDLEDAKNHAIKKHDVEIDLYVDFLEQKRTQQAPISQQYNFYGSVGAVQTGANATANVVQNLGSDDRTALIEALALAREAIRNASGLVDTQKTEMIAIAKECEEQINSGQPNNTKLLTLLTVLGTTVQSIASAPVAYSAMKTVLLPLGISLP